MGRRRAAGPSITLFSFQDIVTSVTGIMILVTLMMAVELIQRRQHSSAQPVASETVSAQPSREQTAEDRELRARLESRREALKLLAGMAPGQIAAQARELTNVVERLEAEAVRISTRYERIRRSHEQAAHSTAHQTDELRKTNKRVRELEELVQQVSTEKRVVYNPVEGNLKQAWLVELSDDRTIAAALGKQDKPDVFAGAARQADFRAWAASRDKNREYFVLLVKPASITAYKQARSDLTELGFDLGYDLLAADQTAVDPLTGVTDR